MRTVPIGSALRWATRMESDTKHARRPREEELRDAQEDEGTLPSDVGMRQGARTTHVRVLETSIWAMKKRSTPRALANRWWKTCARCARTTNGERTMRTYETSECTSLNMDGAQRSNERKLRRKEVRVLALRNVARERHVRRPYEKSSA
mmetsp:Transcript_132/g.1010  ORF Transcript_132/g.1010 Transcript_132/m.1010 type:complete len:149 (-) Transcript_132:404-850(-)